MTGSKTCNRCKEEKPATLEYFYNNQGRLRSYCKSCHNKKTSDYYQTDKGKAANAKAVKNYRKNNLEKRRASALAYYYTDRGKENVYMNNKKRRARQNNAPVVESFTRQDILDKWGTDCHICKKPVDVLDWHMEHVLPLVKGGEHSLTNVKPSHPKCNLVKGTK